MVWSFRICCLLLGLCLAAPFAVQAALGQTSQAPSHLFRAAFLAMALGVPFFFVCVLILGITLPKPPSLFQMPVLHAGLTLIASPLLLRAAIAGIDQFLPGYASGPKGMSVLASYLNGVLFSAGMFACAAALTTFVISHRRARLAAEADTDRPT